MLNKPCYLSNILNVGLLFVKEYFYTVVLILNRGRYVKIWSCVSKLVMSLWMFMECNKDVSANK